MEVAVILKLLILLQRIYKREHLQLLKRPTLVKSGVEILTLIALSVKREEERDVVMEYSHLLGEPEVLPIIFGFSINE
jgi:hypothetical protein